jgi:hypothetical protein
MLDTTARCAADPRRELQSERMLSRRDSNDVACERREVERGQSRYLRPESASASAEAEERAK